MKSVNILYAGLALAGIVLAGMAGTFFASGDAPVVVRTYHGSIDEGAVSISETINDSYAPSSVESHTVGVKVTVKLADESVIFGFSDDDGETWDKVEQCFFEDMPKCYSYTLYYSGGRIFRDWSESRDGVTARGDYLANEALLTKAVSSVMMHRNQTSIK